MSRYRERILLALDRACRKAIAKPYHPLRNVSSDQSAANWGPMIFELEAIMPMPVPSKATINRVLLAEVTAGRVLRAKPHAMQVRWWPVGLWDKLQAERAAAAAQEGGVA